MAARLTQDRSLLICSECDFDKFAVYFHVSFFEHFSLIFGLFVSTNYDVFATVWGIANVCVGVISDGLVADAFIWFSETGFAHEFWRNGGYELLASLKCGCVEHWAEYGVWEDGGLVWLVSCIVLEEQMGEDWFVSSMIM